MVLVLGIESSCDDTACSIVDAEGRVVSSIVSSQLDAHRPYGGVVPEIASREHLANWPAVAAAALAEAGIELGDVGAVAATKGPGLLGSLLVGLSLGKAIAYGLGRPFFAVHHLEGHLYSPFLVESGAPAMERPEQFVGLVVSGGHTTLFGVDRGVVSTLVETRDDAIGEVFDKVGKRAGLPYPQGPLVDRLAERGDPTAFDLPVPRAGDDPFFSFSGLKSATIRALERLERDGMAPAAGEPPPPVIDLLAAFRVAAVAQVVDRVERLHSATPFAVLSVSGGVAANRWLRLELQRWATDKRVTLRLVVLPFAGDNAAMIAFAAHLRLARGEEGDPLEVEAASRIAL